MWLSIYFYSLQIRHYDSCICPSPVTSLTVSVHIGSQCLPMENVHFLFETENRRLISGLLKLDSASFKEVKIYFVRFLKPTYLNKPIYNIN